MREARVYFIKPVGMDGPIKIGYSRWIENRRETLAVWSPFPLEVAATICGDQSFERRFHARFFEHHQRQEWFTPVPELLAVIAEINAGTFDVSTLPPPRHLNSGRRKDRGRKWSSEQRERARQGRQLRKVERETGLVLDYPITEERVAEFLTDPYRHGITSEERRRRGRVSSALWQIEAAQRRLAEAKAAA